VKPEEEEDFEEENNPKEDPEYNPNED